MLKTILEKLWQKTPQYIRYKVTRSIQKKFTISVAAIITNENNEVLILDHFFRLKYQWGFPGGFLNSYEQPEEGVRREIKEETRLEISDLHIVRMQTLGRHLEILYRAKGVGEVKISSGEIRGYGWFTLDDLPEIHPREKETLRKILENEYLKEQ